MKSIVFASNNPHKLEEVREKLKSLFEIKSLKDISCFDDIPETADTFEGNAEQKANWILEKYKYDCFADDSGIEIEALQGRPGVFSARFAGENCSYEDNNLKVMKELEGKSNRKARFVTVICLKLNGETKFYRGEVKGQIINEYRGGEGFGYDPIFMPDGFDKTYAEMGIDEKNKFSHRAVALSKMIEDLKVRL
jgi:XTP/dITP diphosphohydrolase